MLNSKSNIFVNRKTRYIRGKLLLVFCLFLLIGCKQKNSNSSDLISEEICEETLEQVQPFPPLEEGEVYLKNKDPFREVIDLQGTQLFPDTFIWKPRESHMYIKGNYLIMKNFQDNPFLVFNYPDLTFSRSIGKRGNGPDEFMFPDIIHTQDDGLLSYAYESTRDDIFKITHSGEMVKLPFKLTGTHKEGLSGEKTIYNIGENDFLYENNSSTGKSIFRTSIIDDSIQVRELISLQLNPRRKSPFNYIGDFAVNISKNRMVYAYKYFKVIKFMDLEANVVRTLNFQQEEFDEGTLSIHNGLDNNVTYYWGISAGDEYVYCMYSGRTPAEVWREGQKGIPSIYVEKYDWNGNPVQKYKLDNWGLVTVDEKNNRLILVSTWQDDPFIVYDLTE